MTDNLKTESEQRFKEMGKKEFFSRLIDSFDEQHKEYCSLKASEEGLLRYQEPVLAYAIQYAKKLIEEFNN